MLRTFIAIEIPPEIKKAIASASLGLQKAAGHCVRWVEPGNLHLTLKFLGDISPANVGLLTQALTAEAGQHKPFQVEVSTLGAFPTPRRPRVLWVGLTAPADLPQLQRAIEAATTRLGYPPEDKPFSPHLTIGRVRDQIAPEELQTLRIALETVHIGVLGTFTASAVHLVKSDLRPEGAVYTPLATAKLA